ncbi:MAG: phosphopantothenoylcysteine decarboxylase [Elusimicrobiota bacterium]
MPNKKRLNTIKGKKVLITAGPTREYLDPVRFLSNASSGTMGIALARIAHELGAEVTLILGPVDSGRQESLAAENGNKGITVVPVITAQEMEAAVDKHLLDTQIFIGAAAVSDYRPLSFHKQKIKKASDPLSIQFVPNPDIIAKVARRTPDRPYVVIGFALETRDLIENAQKKLRDKGLDWIVANRETSIGKKRGAATLLSRWGERIPLGTMSKTELARKIWEALLLRPAI